MAQPISSPAVAETPSQSLPQATDALGGGVTLRAVSLSLGLAVFFGYIIPIVDMKMRNTFLGATHLPPGAIAVLLVLLLFVNPVLHLVSGQSAGRKMLLGGIVAAIALAAFFYSRAGMESLLFWLTGSMAALGILCLFLGRQPLSRNETLTVYITCLFSALAPGHGAENVFVVNLIGPFYYATRENKWLDFLTPYLQPWMTPALSSNQPFYDESRQRIVRTWFDRATDGNVPWGAWLVPLLVWGFFIFVLYVMMACLCVMLRKQWAEREALTFPLLKLPLELTEDVDRPQEGPFGRFFRNPMMWGGFGLAVSMQMLRGLNLYFPDVPQFPLEISTGGMFTEAPWNQIGWINMSVWPVIVGISYLLTTEVSLSFWFFFWFVKFQMILAYYSGFMPGTLPNAIGSMGGGAKTFTFYQQIGCYFAYVAIVLWTGREHLRHIVRRSFKRAAATPDEKEEALSYPAAFWGFVVCLSLLILWSIAAGLSPVLALVLWGSYLVIIIALTRIIAEAGILFVQQGWVPLGTIGQITDAGATHWLLGAKSLPPAAMLQGSLMTDLRGFIMPSFIQGFKLAHDRKIPMKPLLGLMLACSFITFALGTYMNVKLGYQQGGLSLDPWYAGGASQTPASASSSLMKGVSDASWFNTVWIGIGMALTYSMMVARARLLWFPLHPIGFLISQSYPMNMIWFSIFLGWLAKVMITRYGGTETYRKTTPLFLGLALGDVAMMLFWLIIDGWQGRIGHKLMPG